MHSDIWELQEKVPCSKSLLYRIHEKLKFLPQPPSSPDSAHHTPAPHYFAAYKLSLWLTRSLFKSHPSELARPSHSFVSAITRFIPSTSHVLCLGQSLIHKAVDSLELLISLGWHHAPAQHPTVFCSLIIYFLFYSSLLNIEQRASGILSVCATTELRSWPTRRQDQ